MTELEFQNPNWINAIWIIVAVAILFVLTENRRSKSGKQFVSNKMQGRLARTTSLASRIISQFFVLTGLLCFVIAMMRPQFGYVEKKVPHLGAQVMICLDVSKSMLAEDATPNRLERAKSELEVLFNNLKDDQVGLVAFAGSANVLCPLTTDFGYLKMLLREASVSSVGRGGTLLENPIRKAMAGFSDVTDMSKVIVLITDGEDNGSKPLDAAKLAAARGIKIITIGFGLESGTRIEVTDPNTGIKSYIQDANGNDVVSKLDIDMLKKIASNTNGAFIPARVGSLDVESIHRDLIQPLTRASGESKHIIKNEVYQWPLVAGVVMIIFSIMTSNSLAFSRHSFGDWLLSRASLKIIPFLVCIFACQSLAAQDANDSKADAKDGAKAAQQQGLGAEFSSRGGEETIPEDPIDCYNRSVDLLTSNTSFAEELLEEARKKAGDNAHLRFCSSFNLGWVNVNQANEILEQNPKEALKQLQAAADWFREAVRLRPKYTEARENLEIVLRRIAELNDSLNKTDPLSFDKQLDQMIERQSVLVDSCRGLLGRSKLEKQNGMSDELQRSFRLTSVDQRLFNSDLSEMIRRATQLVEEYKQKQNTNSNADQNPDSQTKLRISQIAQALVHADHAAQKLGQARSQLRLKNAQRAALRAASGLDELKRARDQLRNPAEVLSQIIADTELLHQQTKALAAGENSPAAFLGSQTELPAWLNSEYLAQFQSTQLDRTDELHKVLKSIDASDSSQSPENRASEDETADIQTNHIAKELFADSIKGATSLLELALADFRRASIRLGEQSPQQAEPKQLSAIGHLKEAYELFADLKGLLELTYHEQVQLNNDLNSAKDISGKALKSLFEDFAKRVEKNNERLVRIAKRIDKKIIDKKIIDKKIIDKQIAEKQDGKNAESNQVEKDVQNLKLAKALAESVASNSNKFFQSIRKFENESSAEVDWTELELQGDTIEKQLAELRRMFFSIVEHLRETAGRQDTLNGNTDKALQLHDRKQARTDDQKAEKSDSSKETKENLVAPLASQQRELGNAANQIGLALKQMVDQMAGQIQPGAPNANNDQEMLQKYSDASKLVGEGHQLMQEATGEMVVAKINAEAVRVMQQGALEKLLEAIRLLTPPDEQQKDNEQQKQQNQSSAANNQNQSLLQRLRDREAERRKNNNRGKYQERVEKDW